jgi:hypothetical protein
MNCRWTALTNSAQQHHWPEPILRPRSTDAPTAHAKSNTQRSQQHAPRSRPSNRRHTAAARAAASSSTTQSASSAPGLFAHALLCRQGDLWFLAKQNKLGRLGARVGCAVLRGGRAAGVVQRCWLCAGLCWAWCMGCVCHTCGVVCCCVCVTCAARGCCRRLNDVGALCRAVVVVMRAGPGCCVCRICFGRRFPEN